MKYSCRALEYLNSVASSVNALGGMVLSDELRGNVEAQYRIIAELISLEQATDHFIINMELDSELPQAVIRNKRRFIKINSRLIAHLEKIQLQGYNFTELIHTLKLENETLNEEISFI